MQRLERSSRFVDLALKALRAVICTLLNLKALNV